MTKSPSTSSGGQSSVLCPDSLPVYSEILCPHNTVIQSLCLSIHIFQHLDVYSNCMAVLSVGLGDGTPPANRSCFFQHPICFLALAPIVRADNFLRGGDRCCFIFPFTFE